MADNSPNSIFSFDGDPNQKFVAQGGAVTVDPRTGDIYSRSPDYIPGSNGWEQKSSGISSISQEGRELIASTDFSTPVLLDFAQTNQTYIFEGDSLSDVAWSATQPQIGAGNNWVQLLAGYITQEDRGNRVYAATQGNTTADILTQYATEIYPYRPSATGVEKTFLFNWIGINDVNTGVALATIESNWNTYMSNAGADGFTRVAVTILTRTTDDATKIAKTLAFNNYIRQSSNWEYLLDFALMFPNPADTTFCYDGVHLNAAAHTLLARYANGVLYGRFETNRQPLDLNSLNIYNGLTVGGSITGNGLTLSGSISAPTGFTSSVLGTADVTGGADGYGTIESRANNPTINLSKSNGTSDNKNYAFDGRTNTEFSLRLVNDARSSDALVWKATRSGMSPVSFQIYAPLIAKGTTTNDSAPAGYIGEVISSTVAVGSAVSLTTGTPANVTSISLTAGDWEVNGVVDFNLSGATTTAFLSGATGTSATLPPQDLYTTIPLILAANTSVFGYSMPSIRVSLAATTTIYLLAQCDFSAGTVGAFGTIRARRAR